MARYLTLILSDDDNGQIDSAQRNFSDGEKPEETEKAYRRVAAFMQQDTAALLAENK